MGKLTGIEWTDHTFNPWWGCVKISPACDNCYAANQDAWLSGKGNEHWGPHSERRFFGGRHWNEPRRWDRQAAKDGVRRRVFCLSMGDVFERRPDLELPRRRLLRLIEETPNLDWLLLTKRPQNIEHMVTPDWLAERGNVWLGVTAENQKELERRAQHLLRWRRHVPVLFLSCEPLLGPLNLKPYLQMIDWVIVGGESQAGARPTQPEWVRSIRNQVLDGPSRPDLFVKQLGEAWQGDRLVRLTKKGAALEELPKDLRYREVPLVG